MGMVDRGADLSWLSQFPAEQEIVFTALMAMEVLRTRVDGATLVVEVHMSANQKAPTLEQAVARRHALLENMCEDILVELPAGAGGAAATGGALADVAESAAEGGSASASVATATFGGDGCALFGAGDAAECSRDGAGSGAGVGRDGVLTASECVAGSGGSARRY